MRSLNTQKINLHLSFVNILTYNIILELQLRTQHSQRLHSFFLLRSQKDVIDLRFNKEYKLRLIEAIKFLIYNIDDSNDWPNFFK